VIPSSYIIKNYYQVKFQLHIYVKNTLKKKILNNEIIEVDLFFISTINNKFNILLESQIGIMQKTYEIHYL